MLSLKITELIKNQVTIEWKNNTHTILNSFNFSTGRVNSQTTFHKKDCLSQDKRTNESASISSYSQGSKFKKTITKLAKYLRKKYKFLETQNVNTSKINATYCTESQSNTVKFGIKDNNMDLCILILEEKIHSICEHRPDKTALQERNNVVEFNFLSKRHPLKLIAKTINRYKNKLHYIQFRSGL